MTARIVVGVDGSEPSVDALRWAYGEASLRGAAVEVVHAWHYPYVGDVAGVAAYGIGHEALQEGARGVLDHCIERAGRPPGAVAVERVLVQGGPTTVLLDAARGADLLVLGSRGHGGFTGLLLGSVSQQAVHHASCPVVIVPPSADEP